MYDSGVTAYSLIQHIGAECDVSPDIRDDFCAIVINKVEQFLYTEILREYVKTEINYADVTDDTIPLEDIEHPLATDPVSFDDVIKIYADQNEVTKSSAIGAHEFPEKDLYYSNYNGDICLSLNETPDKIVIIHRLRPALKKHDNLTELNVAVPIEFLDLVEARVRGEAYKVANEDGLAAKWLADYNSQLESFKQWANERNNRYGA